MTDFNKINDQELEKVAGGAEGREPLKTVCRLEGGYLAVRTAPEFKYENEIQSCKLYNGDRVKITGPTVTGTGINNTKATYVWITAMKNGVSGYVNAYYLD